MHKIILAALLGAAILPTTPALANQPVWGQHDDHTQNDWHDQKGDYDRRNDQYRRDEDRHDNYRHDNYRHDDYRHDDYRRDDYRHDNYRHDGRPDAYDSYGRYRQPRPLRRDDHIWRGRDGRYHCRRDNGTEGLIIGAAVGALVGRSLDNGRDRTIGTLLGAASGGLLGQSIDRGNLRCR